MLNSLFVKVVGVNSTDIAEGIIRFIVESGNEYNAYYWGYQYLLGEYIRIQLSGAELYKPDWDTVFKNNILKEKKLTPTDNTTTYTAYGQIISIKPIIANFGDIELNIGNWSNDPRIIGEYIYLDMLRLEIRP